MSISLKSGARKSALGKGSAPVKAPEAAGGPDAGGAVTLERTPPRALSAPVLPVPKRRARWGLLSAGILLAVICAVATYTLVQRSGERTAVVGLAAPVAWGEVITRGDLTEVQLAADAALRPVPWSQVQAMIGQRAAADLPAGTLLTRDSVEAADAVPGPDQALVGVQVNAAQAPTTPLVAGDRVALVRTSASGAATDVAGGQESAGSGRWTGTVFAVSAIANGGDKTVDVLVDGESADALAQASAAGEVAIVVLPRT